MSSSDLTDERVTQTKHDPYCDCGICAYCNGQEDVHGNRSVSKSNPLAVPVVKSGELTDERLAEIEAVAARADSIVEDFYPTEFAVASAINVIPDLITTLREAREQYNAIVDALAKHEDDCFGCERDTPDKEGGLLPCDNCQSLYDPVYKRHNEEVVESRPEKEEK